MALVASVRRLTLQVRSTGVRVRVERLQGPECGDWPQLYGITIIREAFLNLDVWGHDNKFLKIQYQITCMR